MPAYIKVAGTWNEITGTEQPYVKVSGTWRSVSQIHAKVGGVWKQVYEYDNTGPTVPTPTVVATSGTVDTVSWGAITDAQSGVASATVYQLYYGSTSGFVSGTSQALGSFGASSTTFAIPTNRRNTPSGETWSVTYYIIATDNAGNSTQGSSATGHYTKPYGTYQYVNAAADSRNIGNTAWRNETVSDEGVVGYSSTRAYGAWFYGTDTFQDDNFAQWEPDSGTIYIKRASAAQPNRGNTGTFYIQGHSSGTKSGALTFVGTQITQYLSGNDADDYVALNSGMLTNIKGGSLQGFSLNYHSNTPGFLRGLSDFSGLVTLVYN